MLTRAFIYAMIYLFTFLSVMMFMDMCYVGVNFGNMFAFLVGIVMDVVWFALDVEKFS